MDPRPTTPHPAPPGTPDDVVGHVEARKVTTGGPPKARRRPKTHPAKHTLGGEESRGRGRGQGKASRDGMGPPPP